jgi:hypothetical protein
MSTKSVNKDGRTTATIYCSNKEEAKKREVAYLKRYPEDRYGTCRFSYFETSTGSVELQFIRYTYPPQ